MNPRRALSSPTPDERSDERDALVLAALSARQEGAEHGSGEGEEDDDAEQVRLDEAHAQPRTKKT